MDRERCIEIARSEALKLAMERGDVIGVFICGSMADDKPITYADVDLRVIVDSEFKPPTTYVLVEGVPLEWVYVLKSRYEHLEDVLNAPFLALELAKAIILYDPTGFLEELKMDVLTAYRHRVHVIARAQKLLNAAKKMYENARQNFESGQELSPWDLRCVIFWTGETPPLLLNETPNHRKMLVNLKNIAQRLDCPTLYPMGLETLGAEDITAEEAVGFLVDTLDSIDYVNAVGQVRHFHLSNEKREYWESGIRELIDEGYYRESVWPMLTIISSSELLIRQIETLESESYEERCQRFLDRLGFINPLDLERKLNLAAEWMQQTEQLIERYEVEPKQTISLN
ncbi:TPA: hypothetical protein EYP66_14050 [Candidatus Poribacteria bacterium]|nr:hypothetical protein [Candidatus Poribacteria bacterium]